MHTCAMLQQRRSNGVHTLRQPNFHPCPTYHEEQRHCNTPKDVAEGREENVGMAKVKVRRAVGHLCPLCHFTGQQPQLQLSQHAGMPLKLAHHSDAPQVNDVVRSACRGRRQLHASQLS